MKFCLIVDRLYIFISFAYQMMQHRSLFTLQTETKLGQPSQKLKKKDLLFEKNIWKEYIPRVAAYAFVSQSL